MRVCVWCLSVCISGCRCALCACCVHVCCACRILFICCSMYAHCEAHIPLAIVSNALHLRRQTKWRMNFFEALCMALSVVLYLWHAKRLSCQVHVLQSGLLSKPGLVAQAYPSVAAYLTWFNIEQGLNSLIVETYVISSCKRYGTLPNQSLVPGYHCVAMEVFDACIILDQR